MRESNADEKRNYAGCRLELAQLDCILRQTRPGGDKKLFLAIIADSPHDPEAIPARTFPFRFYLAQHFNRVAFYGAK